MNDYYLEKSNRKDKKYMISFYNKDTNKINTVHFGAKNYEDFILSGGDEEKKKNYIKRHQKNENWNDLSKSGTFARFLLWNKKSLDESIKDMQKRFNIKIHLIE